MKFKRAGILTKIVIAAIIIFALWQLVSVSVRVSDAQQQQEALQQQADRLTEDNARLQYALENADRESVIAAIARDKLGLVLPGEKVFWDVGN